MKKQKNRDKRPAEQEIPTRKQMKKFKQIAKRVAKGKAGDYARGVMKINRRYKNYIFGLAGLSIIELILILIILGHNYG